MKVYHKKNIKNTRKKPIGNHVLTYNYRFDKSRPIVDFLATFKTCEYSMTKCLLLYTL